MVAVEHQRPPLEHRGIHHPGSDLSPNSGKLLQPIHRRAGPQTRQVRQIDRAAQSNDRAQARREPLGRYIGIGLRRQFILKCIDGRGGNGLPRTVTRQQSIGRCVRSFCFGPRADDTLDQHPFGRAPGVGSALDAAEALEQERLQTAQDLGARIGTERQLHCG